jgi:hypothetical protein
MNTQIKKEEVVKNSNQPQNGKGNLMGIPSNPNQHLRTLLKGLYDEFGERNINKQIEIDGLPIFIQRVLLGYMSSGSLIQQIVNRYGFEEVQSDLEWLKELIKITNTENEISV